MYTDFTGLNKAHPKDSFSLLKIDQLVDFKVRHGLMSFMDAFSSYNHICMSAANEENAAFFTDQRMYYYLVMSFELKNTSATY